MGVLDEVIYINAVEYLFSIYCLFFLPREVIIYLIYVVFGFGFGFPSTVVGNNEMKRKKMNNCSVNDLIWLHSNSISFG